MTNRLLLVAASSLCLLGSTWTVPAVAAELDDISVKLFNMQKAATERDPSPQAQYYLAQMYENGLGTQEDVTKARELYQSAANKGLTVAKLQLQELERAEHEEQVERERASARAAKPAQKPLAQAGTSHAKVAAAIDEDAAEAARRVDRERARAERKRRAVDALRKAMAAAKAVDPFGEEQSP